MIWFTIIGILVVVLSYFYFNQKSWDQSKMEPPCDGERNDESLPEVKRRVLELISHGDLVVKNEKACPNELLDSLGFLTREFFLQYKEVQTANGALRLSANGLRPSEYISGYISIGNSEDWDVIVWPGKDQVFIVEGGEKSLSDIDVGFQSVYHMIVDEGRKAY